MQENSLTLVQVFSALATAVATIALWRVTKVLAVETKTLAKMTAQPFVVCWLESSAGDALAMNLTLRNTGNATAFDVKMTMTPALSLRSDGTPAEGDTSTVFNPSLIPPGQMSRIRGDLAQNIHDTIFNVVISWSDRPGSENREELEYSFEPKDGFRAGYNPKGVDDIAKSLEGIRKGMAK